MAPTLSPSWKVLSGVACLGAMMGGVVAIVSLKTWDAAFPVSAACSAAVLWVTIRRARSTLPHDPPQAFVLALGAAGISAFIVAWIWLLQVEPMWVTSVRLPFRDPIVPPGVMAAFAVLPIGVLCAEGVTGALRRPLRAAIRPLTGALAVAVVALSALGLFRGASLPTSRHPFDRLAVVGQGLVTPMVDQPVAGAYLNCVTVPRPDDRWGPNCQVSLRPSRSESPPTDGFPTVRNGTHLQVLRDQRHDLWIVQTPWLHDRPHPIAAFRGSGLARVNLGLRDFPGEFAPPLGWPIAALLGVVIAGWLARRARYVDAMPPGPLADATLGADGTLLLADGSTRAVGGGAAPVGPVVVAAATGATAPYRDGAPIDIVRVGTLAQWNDALRDERDVRYALAFSTLVLLGTPMAIAAGLRLLW